ncbi:hypothetical protein AVEN_110214-1 [Araneus ventricosus]|uniref:Uncharacterized protein n=1 Tax=Araneus ventricosus TaxID=182803 RepID=A0A4Y2FAJ5_ARAVE|nr:hypothetical protein AVEN_110214-1 [Araneus ventricosus]
MRVITTIRKSLELGVQCLNFIVGLRPNLQPGSSVFVQNRVRLWEPAEVLRQIEIPRFYCIRTPNGEVRTRNRIHLRPNKCSDFSSYKNFTDPEEYSTSDAIPESIPTVRP